MSDHAEELHTPAAEMKGFKINETQLNQAPSSQALEQQGLILEQLIERLTDEEQRRLANNLETEPETHWLPLYEQLLQSEVLLVVSKSSPHPGIRSIITMAHDAVQLPVFSRFGTALQDTERAEFYDFVWVKFSTLCRLAIEQGAEGILLNADGPIDILFDYYEIKYMAENQLPPQRPVLHEQMLAPDLNEEPLHCEIISRQAINAETAVSLEMMNFISRSPGA